MTLLEIPDPMVKAVLRFVSILERTGIHEKTFKHWFDKQLTWAGTEAQKIDPPSSKPTASPRQRLHTALVCSGEGFQSPDGMEVSQRCIDWAIAAYFRQVGELKGLEKLAALTEGQTWWFITERLPDEAVLTLATKLENEYLNRFKPNAANAANSYLS